MVMLPLDACLSMPNKKKIPIVKRILRTFPGFKLCANEAKPHCSLIHSLTEELCKG